MNDKQAAMREKLAQLRASYAENLVARIDELALHLEDLAGALDDDARMEILALVQQEAHKLAGSGATFGFPEVSTLARDMEQRCKEVTGGQQPFSATEPLYALCGRLREAAIAPASLDEGMDVVPETKAVSEEGAPPLVLVMENDADAVQIRQEIEHFGYKARVINHPTQLEDALTAGRVDVLVCGLAFGDDTESALVELTRLRTDGILKQPLIVLTHLSDMSARLGAVRAGAAAYMVKPVDMTDLVDELDKLTNRTVEGPFRVLIIDDDESLARHTELVLQGAGMHTLVRTQCSNLLEVLDDFSPEMILLDLYMPGCSGEEVAAVIRQSGEYAGVPIVFLSGESDKDKQLSAMELGGDDFLTKPIRPSHLISSLRIRAARFRELRSFMVRDSMTGLYNHTTTKQLLNGEIARAQRNSTPLALAALDIDHFKNVNDSYGHAVGDRVIKALARLMRQRLRSADVIGRMGGEEFAAVLPGSGLDEAEQVFNQIRTAFSEIQFHADDDTPFNVTISCGIAAFPTYADATGLSDAADKALYAAKHGGRNQVVRAD